MQGGDPHVTMRARHRAIFNARLPGHEVINLNRGELMVDEVHRNVPPSTNYDESPQAGSNSSKTVVPDLIRASPDRRLSRYRCWIPESRFRKKPQTSRRRLYQPREDDNRTDHLLYGRSRYRVDVGRKKTWPYWNQGVGLFRGRFDAGTVDWVGRGEFSPPGSWFQYRFEISPGRTRSAIPVFGSKGAFP